MKKLLLISIIALATACGDRSGQREEREAAADEEVDIGSGEEVSPQLELDSADNRFEVDTVSSTEESKKEGDPEDESF